MGKDKRVWRKLVKKLRRKKKRQLEAQRTCEENIEEEKSDTELESDNEDGDDEVELDSRFFLTPEEWEYREEQAQLDALLKKAEKERMEQIELEKQRKIREEWEAKVEQERKLKEEKERLEKMMKEKQEADFNEFLSFLSGDIETPPTRYLMPDATVVDETEVCFYFAKTATCRFQERCTKLHPRPTLSTAILIPNFFSHFKLEQSVRDEYDSDIGLEYEDKELYKEFLEFYDDVVPELRKHGTLVQFKVCCNLEPHLRGNVYIQYKTIQEAVEAFRKFNGRFYNGKQLSLQFIKMDSWRSAICGSFLRKACIKGRTCNYLHVFRNPTKEFVQADHDWKDNFSRNQASASQKTGPSFDSTPIVSSVGPRGSSIAVNFDSSSTSCEEVRTGVILRNGEIQDSKSSTDPKKADSPSKSASHHKHHSKRKHKHRSRSRSSSDSPMRKERNHKAKKEKKKKSKKHKKDSHHKSH